MLASAPTPISPTSWTLCGVAVPSGFRTDGLPLGVTVIADAFAEAKAAAIAAAFHRATGLALGAVGTAHPV